jgi:tetratricopeptide (TPR) repeat protein
MRVWLYILCGLPLMLTGCLTGVTNRAAASGLPGAAVSLPPPDDAALATALAHFAQGRLLESELGPDSELALESYRQALAADPGNHDLASRVAVCALHRKDPQAAVAAMESSYHADPADYQRTVDLAAVYQSAERFDDAIAFYRKALAIDATPTAVYIALSGILFHTAKDGEALSTLLSGHQKAEQPLLIGVYLYDQARRFVANDDFKRAIPCLDMLKAWDEVRKPEVHLVLAELYAAEDRNEEAAAVLREALAMPDPPPEIYTALALVIRKHSMEESVALLETARTRFAESPNALFTIGVIHAEMGRPEKAIALFSEARDTAVKTAGTNTPPVLAEPYFLYLGAAYEQLDRPADAEAVFTECLALYPDSHRVMNYLAYMWADADRNLEQALQYSVRSLTLDPDNGAYTDTLGWIQFRLKQHELALETVTRARLLAGDDAEILLHLGDILAALGKMDDAVAAWKKSAEADPSSSNRAIEQLNLHGTIPPPGN